MEHNKGEVVDTPITVVYSYAHLIEILYKTIAYLVYIIDLYPYMHCIIYNLLITLLLYCLWHNIPHQDQPWDPTAKHTLEERKQQLLYMLFRRCVLVLTFCFN